MQALLIDVRTEEEFTERHAPSAINIPVDEIVAGELGVLEKTAKDMPIHLYCRSGHRSEMAKEALELRKFTNVLNLGGVDDIEG